VFKELNRQRGFTFIELTIAMALFSMVLISLTAGIIQLYKIYQAGLGVRSTQQVARTISDDITRTGREAAGFEVSAVTPTQPVATNGGVIVNSPQRTMCYFNSSFRRRATIYYTEVAGPNQFNFFRATITNPTPLPPNTCDRARIVAGSPQRLNSIDTSVLRFDATVDPTLPTRMLNFEIVVGATSAIQAADLERRGANEIQCFTQVGSQFCSITRYNGGSALRLFQ
jgi:prepilin-type N-terminal cleavage/methylation domain-containing protein